MNASPTSALSTRDYVRAGILTAVIPVALAFAMYWLAPWGCDANAWLCLVSLSMLGTAPIAALCLPVLVFLNRRRSHPFPDGWLSVMALTGCASQLLVTGVSLWALADYLRRIFLLEALIVPYGFVAGAIIGAIFRASLTSPMKSRRTTS